MTQELFTTIDHQERAESVAESILAVVKNCMDHGQQLPSKERITEIVKYNGIPVEKMATHYSYKIVKHDLDTAIEHIGRLLDVVVTDLEPEDIRKFYEDRRR